MRWQTLWRNSMKTFTCDKCGETHPIEHMNSAKPGSCRKCTYNHDVLADFVNWCADQRNGLARLHAVAPRRDYVD
jgi:hypothetical protein